MQVSFIASNKNLTLIKKKKRKLSFPQKINSGNCRRSCQFIPEKKCHKDTHLLSSLRKTLLAWCQAWGWIEWVSQGISASA